MTWGAVSPFTRQALGPLIVLIGVFLATSVLAADNIPLPLGVSGGPAGEADPRVRSDLQQLAAQDARVADVAYRLAVSNVQLCPETAPQLGLVLHSALQYSPRLRAAVRANFGIDDRPAVLAIVPNGPAARAGLLANDILLSVNGEPVSHRAPYQTASADDEPQSYHEVDNALSALQAALRLGPANVKVQRGASALDVTLNPLKGCAYDTQLMPSDSLNASADGHHIFIDTAFASYAASDNDLALILGHELAHDALHHRAQLDRHGFARKLIGNLGSSRRSLISVEQQADYVGLYLTARAGYDISGAGLFWRKLARDHGDPWFDHWDHPSAVTRSRALDAARDEIAAKIKAGAPLIPNVRDSAN